MGMTCGCRGDVRLLKITRSRRRTIWSATLSRCRLRFDLEAKKWDVCTRCALSVVDWRREGWRRLLVSWSRRPDGSRWRLGAKGEEAQHYCESEPARVWGIQLARVALLGVVPHECHDV